MHPKYLTALYKLLFRQRKTNYLISLGYEREITPFTLIHEESAVKGECSMQKRLDLGFSSPSLSVGVQKLNKLRHELKKIS